MRVKESGGVRTTKAYLCKGLVQPLVAGAAAGAASILVT